jgi:hypothetical protein
MNMKKIALILFTIVILSSLSGCILLDDGDTVDSDISNKPDTDKDGVPDEFDDFPDDPSASIDSDDDGYPDRWNPGKNKQDSTTNPPLELDEFPNDPNEWTDTDGDRVGDNSDTFPNNPLEWTDTDGDGYGDNSDINPFVDLSIEIKIEKFSVSSRVDLLRWAQVYFEIKIDGEKLEIIDDNGKRWNVRINRVKEINHDSIFFDIPDDSTDPFTNIEIIMIDYDFIGTNDIIDINQDKSKSTLILQLDNKRNTIDEDGFTEGDKGKLWYEIILSDESLPDDQNINRIYKWSFNNVQWKLEIGIPVETYERYVYANIDRSPQDQPFPREAMAAFVTSNEKVIVDLAHELRNLAETRRFNAYNTANFILRFVQENVEYSLDNETQGCVEYWKFPVETLVDKIGDCEDSAILYASVMDALGYDVALLFYKLKEKNSGHLAVGINLDGEHGEYVEDDGKKYYYCETTTTQFNIGQLPPEIKDQPKKIIHI